MQTPLVNGTFELKKGKEKGAWTFIEMPILAGVPKKRNSTVRVRGNIDAFELRDFHIWAMKKGTFMAVKADIRKIIRKEAGDTVELTLFLDEAPMVIPDDFLACLNDEPGLLEKFMKLDAKARQSVTDWIFAPKIDQEIVARMGKVIDGLQEGKVRLGM